MPEVQTIQTSTIATIISTILFLFGLIGIGWRMAQQDKKHSDARQQDKLDMHKTLADTKEELTRTITQGQRDTTSAIASINTSIQTAVATISADARATSATLAEHTAELGRNREAHANLWGEQRGLADRVTRVETTCEITGKHPTLRRSTGG